MIKGDHEKGILLKFSIAACIRNARIEILVLLKAVAYSLFDSLLSLLRFFSDDAIPLIES